MKFLMEGHSIDARFRRINIFCFVLMVEWLIELCNRMYNNATHLTNLWCFAERIMFADF